MRPCDQVDAFVDGELDAAAAEAFRAHLATCEACGQALHDRMMLEAAVEEHAPALRALHRPNVTARSDARAKRRGPSLALLVALVPAAAAALWAVRAAHPRGAAPVVASIVPLTTATTRSMEPRISYAAADRYRPYDVPRAAGVRPHEEVPLSTLADLEKKGDLRGVAAGLALAGEDERAAKYLERAGASVDDEADRAALLVAERKSSDALEALDRVLAKSPKHAQALFNRALVLRDLGLPLAAAEAFDKVAELGEPGWSDEAKARAKALRAEEDSRRDAWDAGKKAGLEMMNGGPIPSDAVVRAAPDMARHYLYHAVRSAPTRERVLSLAPLAVTLDGIAGGHVLQDWLARSAARDFAKRAPLAATYAKLVASGDALDAKGQVAYLAALRAAGESDMLLGAVPLVDVPTDAKEYTKLATASGDPWFVAIAMRLTAADALSHGDFARAEESLRDGIAKCASAHVDWRCAQLEHSAAFELARAGRTPEARAMALDGLRRARTAAHEMEARFIVDLGNVAHLEATTSLLRAYVRETELLAPSDCGMQRAAHDLLASADLSALRPSAVIADVTEGDRCDGPVTLLSADMLTDAVRMGGALPAASSGLDTQIEALRAKLAPAERPFADVVAARLAFTRDPAHGSDLAHRALDEVRALPSSDVTGQKAETYAHLTLAVEATLAGRGDEALLEIARGARAGDAAAAASCTLGVLVDDDRLVAVSRDASGRAVADLRVRTTPDLDPQLIAPESVRERLAGCPAVRVLALPPLHGLSRLLPAAWAWGYVSGRGDSAKRASGTKRVVVADVNPPAALGLPALADWSAPPADAVTLRGNAATPSRMLEEIVGAGEIEIHAHGFVDGAQSAASLLALSMDSDGRYAVSAADLVNVELREHPVVVLGACHAAKTAPYFREAWSLPNAFVRAGARAVLASSGEVSDAEAGPFFESVLVRIRAGAEPAVALRDERVARLEKDPGSWVADVMEFE